jgi:hypothetical protein
MTGERMRKMTTPLFLFAALLTAMPSSGKDEWQSDLHKWTASSQTDPNCKVRYITGIYRPDLGDKPVWGFMTENIFKYLSKDGAKLAPSVCPVTRTTKDNAEYRVLFSITPMKTFSQTTHGSETQTTTQPFNANVTYSDGSTATVQGEQTSTVVVPTETTISRSTVAVYMYTYRVQRDQLELISTDEVVFSRVAASGSGSNAAGAELGAGIGNLIRKSKDRHRTDKLCEEALKAILAEAQPTVFAQEEKLPKGPVVSADQSAKETKPTVSQSSFPVVSETTSQSSKVQPQPLKNGEQLTAPPPSASVLTPLESPAASVMEGTTSITSAPEGAEIFIDSTGRGRTPMLLKLKSGKHSVQLELSGYKDWVSDVQIEAGSIVNVTADLQK